MAVFRVEKTKDFTVMCNHHLRNVKLSLKAKGLLSFMLSLPEDWDYTTKGLVCICKDGVDSIGSTLKKLEQHGYLTRKRIRFENGRLGDIEYTIHEKPASRETEEDPPKRENPEQVKPIQAKPGQGKPEQGKHAQLNTDQLNTDRLNTHQSIYPAEPEAAGRWDGMDRMELAEAYREIISENVEYGILAERYGEQRMDETVELMLEVVLLKRPYIRIAGDDFPREVVRSRFLKINSSHLEYVFGCIDRNTTKVGNIKAYLLAALAKELQGRGLCNASVILAAGLPIKWLEEQAGAFRKYLMQKKEVVFKCNGTRYHVKIEDVEVYAQGFAAIAENLKDYQGFDIVVDIGNGTMNVIFVVDGIPDSTRYYTERFWVDCCVIEMRSKLTNRVHSVVDDLIVKKVLKDGTAEIGEKYLKAIGESATGYTEKIVRKSGGKVCGRIAGKMEPPPGNSWMISEISVLLSECFETISKTGGLISACF